MIEQSLAAPLCLGPRRSGTRSRCSNTNSTHGLPSGTRARWRIAWLDAGYRPMRFACSVLRPPKCWFTSPCSFRSPPWWLPRANTRGSTPLPARQQNVQLVYHAHLANTMVGAKREGVRWNSVPNYGGGQNLIEEWTLWTSYRLRGLARDIT
jgi:hypothetical protein